MDPKLIRKGYLKEVAFFEKQAGRLPNKKSAPKYENIGAVWVISGGGSYLSAIIDTPSDHAYGEKKWYPNQDKRRLDYAKAVLDSLSHLMPKSKPTLIYNGTRKQNLDLRKAISQGLFKFPMSRLYIAPGKITKTLEQVKKFTFPPGFRPEKMKLGLLSHSVHLPRVLRFMNRHSKKFKAVRIIPFSLNLPEKALERQMADCELETLLGYISRDEASIEPYPFEKNGSEEVRVSVMRREDSKDVLALSNQKSVRRASFNPKKIELSEKERP